jgi:hypothetical protein
LVSIARGVGKPSENAEDQGLSLQIVDFNVARRSIDALAGLGKPRQAADSASLASKPL